LGEAKTPVLLLGGGGGGNGSVQLLTHAKAIRWSVTSGVWTCLRCRSKTKTLWKKKINFYLIFNNFFNNFFLIIFFNKFF
jgi:hypothetical protein